MTLDDFIILIQRIGVPGVAILGSLWFIGKYVWPFVTGPVWTFVTDRFKVADTLLEQANAERIAERTAADAESRAEREAFTTALAARDAAMAQALGQISETLKQHDIVITQALNSVAEKLDRGGVLTRSTDTK